jgi:hypothetical protein
MDSQPASRPAQLHEVSGRISLQRYMWCVAAATFLVAVCPIALVWGLRSADVVSSAGLCVLLAIALSLGASRLGSGFWKTRKGAGDILFNELMVWGFIRRWRNERRLASARELLGAINEGRHRSDGHAGARLRALERLGSTLESTDPHTHGHSRRVTRHAWMIAKQLGLRGESLARVRTAAALHDVGKLHTPPAVLRKPGRLTDEEYEVIKRHPLDGAQMVGALADGELTSIVRHHHERLDGTGYPDRLAGEQIPLGARIIAVADTFDAITSVRPYRSPRSHKEALDILKYEAGAQLDPDVVKAFCAIYSGRGPLALWASLTSLPAQAFSWVGGTAVGAASAAQVAAVATIAAVGSVAAPPVARHHAHRSATQGATGAHAIDLASTGGPTPAGRGQSVAAPGRSGAGGHAAKPRAGARHAHGPAATPRQPVASTPAGEVSHPVEATHVASVTETHSPGGETGHGGPSKPSPGPVASTPPVDTPLVSTTPPVSITPPASGKPAPEVPVSPAPEKSEHPEKPAYPENPVSSGSGSPSGLVAVGLGH